MLPLIVNAACVTLTPALNLEACVTVCWLALTMTISGDVLNVNPSNLYLLRFEDVAEPDSRISPCQSNSGILDT